MRRREPWRTAPFVNQLFFRRVELKNYSPAQDLKFILRRRFERSGIRTAPRLTSGRQSINLYSMPDVLTFAYATAGRPAFTKKEARTLAPEFEFASIGISDISAWKTLCDFVWLDLGRVSAKSLPKDALEILAGLQPRKTEASLIFISGKPPRPRDHSAIAELLFNAFPRPEAVEVDLAGEPDVMSAIAKWRVMRRKPVDLLPRIATRGGAPHRAAQIPNHDLHDSTSGRLSADAIRKLYGVTLTQLCEWIGKKKAAVSKTPDAASLQDDLRPLAGVALMRLMLGSNEKFRIWLNTANELLERKSPLHWIANGKTLEVSDFVQDALTGQPT